MWSRNHCIGDNAAVPLLGNLESQQGMEWSSIPLTPVQMKNTHRRKLALCRMRCTISYMRLVYRVATSHSFRDLRMGVDSRGCLWDISSWMTTLCWFFSLLLVKGLVQKFSVLLQSHPYHRMEGITSLCFLTAVINAHAPVWEKWVKELKIQNL